MLSHLASISSAFIKDFLETDLFEFLGTSARSFKDNNQSNFLSRYNLVVKEVIPFCPEPILKTDGETKNDCERNASKRLLEDIRREQKKGRSHNRQCLSERL